MLTTRILHAWRPAILSRGYKRTSKGFQLLPAKADATVYGDEPVLFKSFFPEVPVAVCENRPQGIEKLKHQHPDTGVVILDDAFQHRRLKPGLSILLIEWSSLKGRQFLLPAGDLRDIWSRRWKADIIVISKCPDNPSEEQKRGMLKKLMPNPNQRIYFSWYAYSHLLDFEGKRHEIGSLAECAVLLVSGLANTDYLLEWINKTAKTATTTTYPDHHKYTPSDIHKIHQKFGKFATFILTTEKDRVKLEPLIPNEFKKYWLSIQIEVRMDSSEKFENEIISYVKTNSGNC